MFRVAGSLSNQPEMTVGVQKRGRGKQRSKDMPSMGEGEEGDVEQTKSVMLMSNTCLFFYMWVKLSEVCVLRS